MPTLTRLEAQSRAAHLTPRAYTIDLDLTPREGTPAFGSTTTVEFTAHHAGDTFVELRPTTLHSATLDGRPLDPGSLVDGRLPLTGLAAGEHTLHLVAEMPYSHTGEGLHRFTDPADGEVYLYSMCFQTSAPLVYACFDQPDLKAPMTVSATVPEEWTFLTNAIATRDPEQPGRWHAAPTPPLSSYLLAVAAGPYHSLHSEHAGIPLALHARRSLAADLDKDAEELFDVTRRSFDHYHQLFDEPYPFDSYDQLFGPELNAGAMENPGLVVLTDSLVFRSAVTETQRQDRAVTLAHEMAHMWFGNLVTLRWWDDIWLNESFAEYMGEDVIATATHWTGTWTDFCIRRKAWGYDADQRPSTHPVAPTAEQVPDAASALQNFDGISYAKGASVLRQLVAWLGAKEFLAGVNTHITRHRFGNAALADFIDSLAAHTDRDVHGWAEQWLRTTGADTLTPRITEGEDGGWQLHVDHAGSRPHRIHIGAYDQGPQDPGDLTERRQDEADLVPGATTVLTFPGPRPDLVVLNDHDLTWAKVRFDARSWETLGAALSGLRTPLTRAVVWGAARDLTRDGLLAPDAYLEVVRAHLLQETDNALLDSVLGFARHHVADLYLTGADRQRALETLHGLTHRLLTETARPAQQLTALRHHVLSTTDPAELRPWPAEGRTPYGLELDPELRWLVLHRLTVLGAVPAEEIEAEYGADPSATGRLAATRCRAALPDPEAKAAVWAELFDPLSEWSNYRFTAGAQGFWPVEQAELTAPYRVRYFADAVRVAHARGEAIGRLAGRHAFPHTAVDPAVLAEGRRTLEQDDLPPELRRHLVDQLDDLRRASEVRRAAAG